MAHQNALISLLRTLEKQVFFIGAAELNTCHCSTIESFRVHLYQSWEGTREKLLFLLNKREAYPVETLKIFRELKNEVSDGYVIHRRVRVQNLADKNCENSQRKYLEAFLDFLNLVGGFLDFHDPVDVPLNARHEDVDPDTLLTKEEEEELLREMPVKPNVPFQVMLLVTFLTGFPKFDSLTLISKVRLLVQLIPIHPKNMAGFINACNPLSNVNRFRYKSLNFEEEVKKFVKKLV